VKSLVWLILTVALVATGVASAVEWDQARVTKLAGEFDTAVGAVVDDPGVAAEQPSAMQERRHQAAIATLKQVRRLASEMSRMLQGGNGRSSTEPLYIQMEELIDQARVFAEDSWVKPASREKVDRARTLLDQLRLYYRES